MSKSLKELRADAERAKQIYARLTATTQTDDAKTLRQDRIEQNQAMDSVDVMNLFMPIIIFSF